MNENPQLTIKDAIDNLSPKKGRVSSKALDAKRELNDTNTSLGIKPGEYKQFNKNINVISNFNESVTLLSVIFQKSHFDRLALFISAPTKVLILNFIIGIVQGLGFAVGISILVIIINILLSSYTGLDIVDFIQSLLTLN